MSYIYRGYTSGKVTVVDDDGTEKLLPHLMYHSPDGFSWGYAGSGPSDLARSIAGHFLGVTDPEPALYQALKFRFIVSLPHDRNWAIHENSIRHWLDTWLDGKNA